jgi:peptidase E
VLAIGGLREPESMGWTPDRVPLMIDYAARLAGSDVPRICIVNTATGDDAGSYLKTYAALSAMPSRVSHLQLFPMPNVPDPADLLLSQDIIFVGGGSAANLLAVWRVHGLDLVMRSAWQSGVVMAGVSAGAICWFAGGTTDSFGQLRPLADGLGLLPGSYCPHYDSEPGRRPLYRELVASGTLPAGIACDDGAAAHFIDDSLAEIVADRRGAQGYRVAQADDEAETVAETPLPTRFLDY